MTTGDSTTTEQMGKIVKLEDLRPGDWLTGFEGWGCIPLKAKRLVQFCEERPYLCCREGKHFLDGQEDDGGHLVGMSFVKRTLNPTTFRAAKALWDAERAALAVANPEWPMPVWSRAPAWRRRPYILEAMNNG